MYNVSWSTMIIIIQLIFMHAESIGVLPQLAFAHIYTNPYSDPKKYY